MYYYFIPTIFEGQLPAPRHILHSILTLLRDMNDVVSSILIREELLFINNHSLPLISVEILRLTGVL
jgi:hypothetical protein